MVENYVTALVRGRNAGEEQVHRQGSIRYFLAFLRSLEL
jgi:hypothetical protein